MSLLWNTLAWWQWLMLASIPPAIVLLYFLKLKRRPLEIPSTYLWHKSIEDLHVNTIWQRLRSNLLLFLQLLLLLLAMLAILQPGCEGQTLEGDRFIFLIDNSASMQATDVGPTRLEEAKRVAGETIELMKPGDVGMIVSFADGARTEEMFTNNRHRLRQRLGEIQPTERSTSLTEALQIASALANPGRSATDTIDTQVAEAMPAELHIFSDGRFTEPPGFLGNLNPVYNPIGTADAANLGVVLFTIGRHETNPSALQAFARIKNFGLTAAELAVELTLDDQLIDAAEFLGDERFDPGEERRVVFDLTVVESGVLRLEITTKDDFPLDNTAWTVINPPRPANVLVITPGNGPLTSALGTGKALELAQVTIEMPYVLDDEKNDTYRDTAAGVYDLVIYDRCRPKVMPQANTFFIGATPLIEIEVVAENAKEPSEASDSEDVAVATEPEYLWKLDAKFTNLQILDVDPTHPLTQWLDELRDVDVYLGTPLVEPYPPGTRVLISSQSGPLLAIAPRLGFEDAVLGFALIDELADADGAMVKLHMTNWRTRSSWPTFVLNVLQYLGSGSQGLEGSGVRPGDSVTLESPQAEESLVVRRLPDGERVKLDTSELGKSTFTDTDRLGVYEVRLADDPLSHFTVNLFDAAESQIGVRAEISVGHDRLQGQATSSISARREYWKHLLLAALAVLAIEWFVFYRRVYL